ncbi:hypothetical protein HNQ02_003599 [Flavobacterium sp. 7E]|uniref:hypothetical protein n=1 Tax=Flavobacterium sp. 7E TaxID=2735898 RepID=UPI00156D6178|nr:hypothetical protein [Flavobacterium sp. 7E]NRS90652.1 hypothetical protein [Flavobacterium sp. 7E]
MKNKIVFSMLFLGALLTGCSNDSVTEAPNYSDVTWYASTPLKTTENAVIGVGKAISIFDLSQGALSHEWKISEGSNFLKTGFKNGDGTGIPPDLTAFIDADKGLMTTDKTVYILYPTVGTYTITLKNTFKDKVIYKGNPEVESVLVDGVWVFEQTFIVTVI